MNIEKIFQTKSLLITSFIIIISSVYYLNQKWNAYPVLSTAEKYPAARYPRLIPAECPREGTAQGELGGRDVFFNQIIRHRLLIIGRQLTS